MSFSYCVSHGLENTYLGIRIYGLPCGINTEDPQNYFRQLPTIPRKKLAGTFAGRALFRIAGTVVGLFFINISFESPGK